MPANAVYVGRPTKWGNPFRLSDGLSQAEVVNRFRRWITEDAVPQNELRAALSELRGNDLICWCRLDQPCHADVLIELANR